MAGRLARWLRGRPSTTESTAILWAKAVLDAVLFFGVFMAVLGHLGDLTESAFKRDLSVKDSGRVVPIRVSTALGPRRKGSVSAVLGPGRRRNAP